MKLENPNIPSPKSNIDFVDAALCAVAADAFRRGEVTLYGDAKEG